MNEQPRSLQIRGWLNALEVELQQETDVLDRVAHDVAVWKSGGSERHKVACIENIYLYFVALPVIFRTVRDCFGLPVEDARKALRGEYYLKYPEFLGGSTIRKEGHPLSKRSEQQTETFRKWNHPAEATSINQAFPDLALGPPAPASVVFDVKYFTRGNPEQALIDGVKEVVFYRGLPAGSEGGSLYSFGCLLAYDASPDGSLMATWKKIENKEMFWRGGNILPIIVRDRLGGLPP